MVRQRPQKMHINVAIIERSPGWTVLKEDIYKGLVYWLQQAGYVTSLTYNEIPPNWPNLIVGNYYLKPEHVEGILKSDTRFALLETEIVRPEGHNETFDPVAFEFQRRLYQSAAAILTGVPANVATFAQLGLTAHLMPLGYCPWLDTSRPLPNEYQDVELLFFGNVDARREAILRLLDKQFTLKVLNEQDLLTHFFRNAWVSRSKIVLSLRRGEPYTHLGVSRSWHVAHLQALTLSEPPGDGDHTADGLCEFYELGQLPEAIQRYLDNPDERVAKGKEFYRNLRNHKADEALAKALQRFVPLARVA